MKFNKDLGSPLATTSAEITQTNADGKPVVPLTTGAEVPLRQKWLALGSGSPNRIRNCGDARFLLPFKALA